MKPVEVHIDDIDWGMLQKSTRWIREKYQIPLNETSVQEFQREFNCTLERDSHQAVRTVVFNTEQDYTLFLLRWS